MKTRLGQVTVIVLLLALMALTIGLSQVSRSLSDLKQVSYVDSGTKSFAAAESGMQYALNQLTGGTVYCPSDGSTQQIDLSGKKLTGISKLEYRICPTQGVTNAEFQAVKADDVVQLDLSSANVITDAETPSNLSNMVAQWNFNETSGTLAASGGTCGSGCDGTLVSFANTSGQDVLAGSGWTKVNKRWGAGALMFNGTNNYVNIPNSTAFDTGSYTISAWVYSSNYAQNGFIFEKGTVNSQYSLFFEGTNVVQRGYNSTGALLMNQYTPLTTAGIINGKWNYMVSTYNGSNLILYVNGAPVSNVSISGTLRTGQVGERIGAYGGATPSYFFNGVIDNLQVYTRALGAAEVLTNFQAGTAFADRADIIWRTDAPSSGIEVIEVDGNNMLSRYLYDGTSSLSTTGTGFYASYPARTACASTTCVLPATYTDANSRCSSADNSGINSIPIKDTAGSHKLIRIKPFVSSATYTTDILICGRNANPYSATLPTLGTTKYTVTVLATTVNGTQKKIQTIKYPSALPSVFDYSLYSNSAITK